MIIKRKPSLYQMLDALKGVIIAEHWLGDAIENDYFASCNRQVKGRLIEMLSKELKALEHTSEAYIKGETDYSNM